MSHEIKEPCLACGTRVTLREVGAIDAPGQPAFAGICCGCQSTTIIYTKGKATAGRWHQIIHTAYIGGETARREVTQICI